MDNVACLPNTCNISFKGKKGKKKGEVTDEEALSPAEEEEEGGKKKKKKKKKGKDEEEVCLTLFFSKINCPLLVVRAIM